ncbi:hydroxymethylbilane synthase [Thiotrichales bacterium 19S3-7]|nr:hydroxymethylbilane synthase [Thiotrichales bacterium 19S3-7]MCF6801076.1 hydroxymethylbilane synthase [Thiotrichales bacterium 19S3-11]
MIEKNTLRIATRKSPLALWQSEYVKTQLLKHYPQLDIEFVLLQTEGDKRLEQPLSNIGGKGLFMKELEIAIKNDQADIAVHSLKDIPYQLPDDFHLACFCQRESPFDAFVSNQYSSIANLPKGAIVGTSSLRRQSQLLNYRNDLIIKPIRGNVNTRLSKLDDQQYDALILAHAGLIRLNLSERIKQIIPDHLMLPAQGQGVISVECLKDRSSLIKMLSVINDRKTQACVLAERTCNEHLQGSCHAPIGVYATEEGENLLLRAIVLSADGVHAIKAESLGHDPVYLGKSVAQSLLKQGASAFLR